MDERMGGATPLGRVTGGFANMVVAGARTAVSGLAASGRAAMRLAATVAAGSTRRARAAVLCGGRPLAGRVRRLRVTARSRGAAGLQGAAGPDRSGGRLPDAVSGIRVRLAPALVAAMSAPACALLVSAAPAVRAQTAAIAQYLPEGSEVTAYASGDLSVELRLSQAVPWRVFTLTRPDRLVMDFRGLGWAQMDPERLIRTKRARGLRYGTYRPGWSRAVLLLSEPMVVHEAGMTVDPDLGEARLTLRLTGASEEEVAARPRPAETGPWATGPALPEAEPRGPGDGRLTVVLDPGHGGVDPGARHGGYEEADVMLQFALRLKEVLARSGRYRVVLTRSDDRFVSLEDRMTVARSSGADLFISLHADALATGMASGTTVYTLSEVASDEASRRLAASHDRDDLLAGVTLSAQDDAVTAVLMDMARTETRPRSERLAEALVEGIARSVGRIRRRPHLSAGFSVLKAPDIPSVLVEVGFLTNPLDLANLTSPDWQDKVAAGILSALDAWSVDDAARAQLLRQ